MVDTLTPEQRKLCMSRVKSKDTNPELLIRRELFRKGFRYKLHDRKLPGKPDLVFPRYKAIVFVHGCFWHGHDCPRFAWPATRKKFWENKIHKNMERDAITNRVLKQDGWRILTVWECALKGKGRLPINKTASVIAKWLSYGKRDKELKGKR